MLGRSAPAALPPIPIVLGLGLERRPELGGPRALTEPLPLFPAPPAPRLPSPPTICACASCSFREIICSFSLRISFVFASSFITGRFAIRFAVEAYSKVEAFSSTYASDGEQQASISVWLLPPSECFSKDVSFESRKGMCFELLPPRRPCCRAPGSDSAARAWMTLRSTKSEVLISIDSFIAAPRAPVDFWRSEPARSTRLSVLSTRCEAPETCTPVVSEPVSLVCSISS